MKALLLNDPKLTQEQSLELGEDLCREASICFQLGIHNNISVIHGIIPNDMQGSNIHDRTLILTDFVDGSDLESYIGSKNYRGKLYEGTRDEVTARILQFLYRLCVASRIYMSAM